MIGRWLSKFDETTLKIADGAVLWLWNTFEVPRIAVVRVLLINWFGAYWAFEMRRAGHIDWLAIVGFIAILIVWAIEELYSALLPRATQALRTRAARSHGFSAFFRWYLHWNLFIGQPLWLLGGHHHAYDAFLSLSAYLGWMATWTVTPTEPPKRRKRELRLPAWLLPNAA